MKNMPRDGYRTVNLPEPLYVKLQKRMRKDPRFGSVGHQVKVAVINEIERAETAARGA